MQPLTSTLADLTAAKLTAYYAPPPAGVPTVAPSTDPAVYTNPDFLKQLNAQFLEKYAVDVPDKNAADRYHYACEQWEQSGKGGPLPTPPRYAVFDQPAFDQWWAQYNADRGQNAPPLFFIKPAPMPPAPVILAADAPPPPPPATDGPIGSEVPGNPGIFNASADDNFPDGFIYPGPTGVYQKHVYTNPFTVNHTRVIWIKLA